MNMTKHKSNQDGFTSRGRGSVRRRRFSSILRVRTSRISRSSPSEAKQGGSGNRSVSPRRNPFREEIRKMKNWKDDSEPFHSTRNGSADICESMEDGKSPARRKVSSANNDQKQRDKDNVIKDWQENLEMKITKELLFLRKSKRPGEATVGAVNRVNPAPLRLPPPTICTYQKETERIPVEELRSSETFHCQKHNVLVADGSGAPNSKKEATQSTLTREELGRNFSLLELKMEVYYTRLQELEWEREQLLKDRKVMKDRVSASS